VLDLAPGDFEYLHPQILPGGKAVLFVAERSPDSAAAIEVFSFADQRRKILARGSDLVRYLPTGHLVYAAKGTLFAIPFDLDRLETRGSPVAILDDIAYDPQNGSHGDWDFAGNGTLIYRSGSPGGGKLKLKTIQWVDGAGKKEPLRSKPDDYYDVSISPDGKRLALAIDSAAGNDVWVYDIQRDAMTRLTFGGFYYQAPNWTPDGRFVVFQAAGKGIYWAPADGAAQPQPLIQGKYPLQPYSFTPDGGRLAYYEYSENEQIWTVPLSVHGTQLKAGEPEQFQKTQFADSRPSFSPDGRWLAYTSNESGKNEVYVKPFRPHASGTGGKWQISSSGGRMALWSQTKPELFYETGRNYQQLMRVSYSVNGDSFVAEKPTVWSENLGWDIDLAPDGKRVAVITPLDTPDAAKEHELTFLFNFFDELRRRVPVTRK
jgi:serine/threonine-protein kinase